ncbi:glutamine--fructose-6-phosphate transaminase (isomerizing) [Candidatus Woesearchaeota archaeon]|nr:glutamine--fructose-6-phosphate transaminase (isomerizing) [Candidatus Woesearchaeota archaeon]
MCGIVGYIGNRKASTVLLECLKRLEYRGYDSVGMACVNDKGLDVRKDVGTIDKVDNKLNFKSMGGSIGLAHSRWSTHGKTTKENAHPHCNFEKDISIVHNGIIENHNDLKNRLEKKGIKFCSETDTEVIVHLVDTYYKGDLKDAVLKSLKKIDGSYAIGLISARDKDKLIAARNESPLIIGLGSGENFIASDVPAVIKYARKVIYLDNKEVAVITKDKVDVFDLEGNKVRKKIHKIDWNPEKAEKQGFEHFMLKEIFEQPDVIAENVKGRIGEEAIRLTKEIELKNTEIKELRRIIIVACGTSWHAGIVGEFMLEELARIPVEVEYASEFRYRDPIVDKGTLVISISQSGETADTLAAVREAKKKGAKILSIVNVVGSSIARESDMVLYTKAGPEIGVASTKAFTSQLIILYLMTVYFGSIREVIGQQQIRNRIRDLRLLPMQIQSILDNSDYIKLHAQKYSERRNALYLGRGINYPIALEGALKLKEVSYIHAEGYPAAEMKHGPIALIDKDMPIVVIATKDNRTYRKVLSNIQEVKARGGEVIGIVTKGDKEIAKQVDHNLYIPENSYILTPLLAVIPLQLFAYYVAVMKGFDPDKPRNLAKAVCVE